MSIQESRRSTVRKRITAFGGIRSMARISDSGAYAIQNFRILSDGSLEKRCGYQTFITGSGTIRGYWEGNLSGVSYCFFVAGNTLYRLSQSDTSPVALTVLSNSDARVRFFLFRERLYLMDGTTVMYFQTATGLFSLADGYVPLYGKNWHPSQLGEVYEPRNQLNTKLRVHYLNTSASQTFRLPFTAIRVDAVTVNGARISNYTFTPPSSSVTIPASYATGGEVLIAFEIDSIFSTRSTLLRAGHGTVYKDGYHETLLTFGGTNGYRVWRTSVVTDEMLAEAQKLYPACDCLYFREGTAFSLGSLQHPVTAALQYLDRVLVMNDTGLWILRHTSATSDDMEISLYQSGIGCVATDGAVLCRGVPVVIAPGGIGKIRLLRTDEDLCSLTLFSTDISDALTAAALPHCILQWYNADSALWVRDVRDTAGTVWCCDPDEPCWIRYTGILATGLIEHQGNPGFTTAAGKIAAFDESLNSDDGQAFNALYCSQYLDFSQPEFCRRSGYAALCADSGGAGIDLRLESEHSACELHFTGQATAVPEFFDGRFGIGRFRFLRYRISVSGTVRVRVYSLSVYATV